MAVHAAVDSIMVPRLWGGSTSGRPARDHRRSCGTASGSTPEAGGHWWIAWLRTDDW
jgi:hypothetical protein